MMIAHSNSYSSPQAEERRGRHSPFVLAGLMLLFAASYWESHMVNISVQQYMVGDVVTGRSAILKTGLRGEHVHVDINIIQASVSEPSTSTSTSTISTESDAALIPSTLHLIHLSRGLPESQEPPPEQVQKNHQDWKAILGSDWTVTLWNNVLVRQEFPELVPVLENLEQMAHVSDILRYHIVERYGGFYVDTDIVPFRSLESLRPLQNFTVCERPRDTEIDLKGLPIEQSLPNLRQDPNSCELCCNAVIASTPQNPALKRSARMSWDRTLHNVVHGQFNYSMPLTGPYMWTDNVKDFQVNVLKTNTFFPCGPRNKETCVRSAFQDLPHVFAMHTWNHSWRQQQKEEKQQPQQN